VTIADSALGPVGRQLGAGGQAKVFELPGLTLPDVAGPVVYKRYRPGRAPSGQLAKIVALRHRLHDPAKRALLDTVTAWPVREVLDAAGAVCGLVLPRIPEGVANCSRKRVATRWSVRC
jgi:DNA-binding helix-hairpin-helix protein with protein kinase domain